MVLDRLPRLFSQTALYICSAGVFLFSAGVHNISETKLMAAPQADELALIWPVNFAGAYSVVLELSRKCAAHLKLQLHFNFLSYKGNR